MTAHSSYYKIGLGDAFLKRAGIIFFTLTVLAFGTTAGAVYAGAKSGDLQKRVLNPIKSFGTNMVASWAKAIEPTPRVRINTYTNYATSSSSTSNQASDQSQQQGTTKVTTYPRPTVVYTQPLDEQKFYEQTAAQQEAAQKSYEERVKEMNEKYNASYQQAVDKMNADYKTSVEASKAKQAEAAKKAQEDFDNFKKEHGL